MKNTRVINYFGAPSSGKSTLAAGVFYKLKMLGHDVELVTEFAKELVWQKREKCLGDQFYVIAQQHHRMWTLNGQVDFIITDSPILLGLIYQSASYPDSFGKFLIDIHNEYVSSNYFLERDFEFSNNGRRHDEVQSYSIHNAIKKMLNDNNIETITMKSKEAAIDEIVANELKKKEVESKFFKGE